MAGAIDDNLAQREHAAPIFPSVRSPTARDFQNLAEHLPALCWMADASGDIFWYNKRWHDYCGTTEKDLPTWDWRSVHDPRKLPEVIERWQQAIATGDAFEMVFPMRRKDGIFRPFLTRIEPMRDERGAVQRWFGMNTDVGELEDVAQRMRQASERIELALNSGAILGTFVWDVPANVVTADDRFARCFSLDPAECLKGVPLSEATKAIHPDDLPEVEAAISATITQGIPYAAEYRVRQSSGTYRWVEANGRCELDAAGRAVRFPGVIVDIERRKLAELELEQTAKQARTAHNLLHAVMEAMPALIFKKDEAGRMEFANSAVHELVGMSWDRLRGRTNREFLDKEQAAIINENDRMVLDTGLSMEVEEFAGYDEEGKPRVWLSRKAPFINENGKRDGLIGTSIEITERKRVEETRRILLRELHHRVKNLFTMVAGMIRLTSRSTADTKVMAAALVERIHALAAAHDLITPALGNEYAGVRTELDTLIRAIIAPHVASAPERLVVCGPSVALGARSATNLALVVHELTTNAAKYGALSIESGKLYVEWSVTGDLLNFMWRERSGPRIAQPTEAGFGTDLIKISLGGHPRGEVDYDWQPEGLTVGIRFNVADLED